MPNPVVPTPISATGEEVVMGWALECGRGCREVISKRSLLGQDIYFSGEKEMAGVLSYRLPH